MVFGFYVISMAGMGRTNICMRYILYDDTPTVFNSDLPDVLESFHQII